MKIFKKLKQYWKVSGAILSFIICGGAASYWAFEVVDYNKNVTIYDANLDRAIFIGDIGEDSEERDNVLVELTSRSPRHIFLLGDLGYPNGVKDQREFDKWIKPYISQLGDVETNCILGNHDSYALNKKERDWLALNADKNGCTFKNYYRAQVYQNACVGILDSTIYDMVKYAKMSKKDKDVEELETKRERQEQFIRKFFSDKFCDSKIKILLGHHTVITYGPHYKDGDANFANFILSLPVNYYVSGHDHILAKTISYGKNRATFLVSGAGAKKDKCKVTPDLDKGYCHANLGFFEFDMNVGFREVAL